MKNSVNAKELHETARSFGNLAVSIKDVYFDTGFAFTCAREKLVQTQIEEGGTTPEDLAKFDASMFVVCKGASKFNSKNILHTTTQGAIKRRLEPSGQNEQFMGNMTLITLFHIWNDEYRKAFASALGIRSEDLKVDVFGDMRIIRNSIVHNSSIATTEIEKCNTLKWFKHKEKIAVTSDMIMDMYKHIHNFLKEMEIAFQSAVAINEN